MAQMQPEKEVAVTLKTNLKCGSCLKKIGPLLDANPLVVRWEADLSHADRLLHAVVLGAEPVPLLKGELARAGFHGERVLEGVVNGFQLSRYRPLFIVVLYVLGFSLLMSHASGGLSMDAVMRNFMGGFFLGFSFFKFLDVRKFADAFATYDWVASRFRPYAIGYPLIELGLGLAYVLSWQLFVVNAVTAILMAVGLFGVVGTVRSGRQVQCACLGTTFNLPMSMVTVVENSVMLLMASYGIIQMVLRV